MVSKKAAGQRLQPDEREQQILRAAITFFAEFGFEGQTRELARRLGITQPLLYRYFPSKDALIERVYREVFLDRWNPQWEQKVRDRASPLQQRLVGFYQDYARAILSYEWVRLLMFAGLKGIGVTGHYARQVSERLHPLVIGEIRVAQGVPPLEEVPTTDAEVERMWTLHAGIVNLGIRRWIYDLPVPADQDGAVAAMVATILTSVPASLIG